MKKYSKLILICLACILVFAGCGTQSSTPSVEASVAPPETAAVQSASTSASTALEQPTATPKPVFNLTAQIEEQVIYDEGGIVVKAVSLESKHTTIEETALESKETETDPYAALNISIENNSDRTVTVKGFGIAVNGITTDNLDSAKWLEPGESGEADLLLGTENFFNLTGITDIAEVDLLLDIEDADAWEVVGTAPVTLTTNIAGSYTQDMAMAQAETAYDENGLKIVALARDEDGAFTEVLPGSEGVPGLLLYIENNTEEPIWLAPRYDMLINGVSIGAESYDTFGLLMINDIMPGMCAYTDLVIEEKFLTKAGVTVPDINQIDCAFVVNDMLTYDKVYFETPVVTMTFE